MATPLDAARVCGKHAQARWWPRPTQPLPSATTSPVARCTEELRREVIRREGQSYHEDTEFVERDAIRSCNASCGPYAQGLAGVCPAGLSLPTLDNTTALPDLPTICFASHYIGVFEKNREAIESSWQRGHAKAGKMRLLMSGLVRDGASSLPRMMKVMQQLGAHFASFRVVILENDSTDDTVHQLQKLSRKFPWMTYQSLKLNTTGDRIGFKPAAMRERVRRMAHARNLLQTLVGKTMASFEPDLIASIDLDLGSESAAPFDPDMAIVTLGREELKDGFDLVCANSLRRYAGEQDVGHHDVFALRDETHLTMNRDWAVEWSNPRNVARTLFKQVHLIPVRSCFGGFAFYNPAALCGCDYDEELDDCEHVSFHRCMGCRGMTRMFVDPLLVTRYESLRVLPQECVAPGAALKTRKTPKTADDCERDGGYNFVQCGASRYCCNHPACQTSHPSPVDCEGTFVQGCLCTENLDQTHLAL
jgi:hypothetical protein